MLDLRASDHLRRSWPASTRSNWPIAPRSRGARIWGATWPKLAAVVIAIAVWQLVVWSGMEARARDPAAAAGVHRAAGSVLERQAPVLDLAHPGAGREGLRARARTGGDRGCGGFALRHPALGGRLLHTGLQTMPSSVVWFPFALIVFKKTQSAIMFVVVSGRRRRSPNGLISGIDQVPPLYRARGRVLGVEAVDDVPPCDLAAALPNVIAGLKQGWAFAWRSLMAGEVLVSSRVTDDRRAHAERARHQRHAGAHGLDDRDPRDRHRGPTPCFSQASSALCAGSRAFSSAELDGGVAS